VISINEKFNDAIGYDFTKWAANKFNSPIVLENDARASLIGEWHFGSAKKFDNVVMITLGTGIGGSAVINGKVLRGKHFQAGCLIGHFTIDLNGKSCTCGNIGCVESISIGSQWALSQYVKEDESYENSSFINESIIDFQTLFRLAAY